MTVDRLNLKDILMRGEAEVVCVQELYCTVMYCTVLYCTVLYCTVLYCTMLYCTVLYLGGGVAVTQPEHEGAQVVGGEVHRHPDLAS